MATVKNGVNYEITANDKASKVLENSTKKVEKATKETGEAFRGEFNPMSTVMAGVSGSVEGVAQQMLGLASRLKSVHMTMMKFSIYAALIMACVKAVKFLSEAFKEAREKSFNLAIENINANAERITAEQEELNKELDESIAKTDKLRDNLNAEIDATEKLTNAQMEYNKALELSLAKTDTERERIERKYSKEQELYALENKLAKNENSRNAIIEKINKAGENLRDLGDYDKELEKDQRKANRRLAQATTKIKGVNYWDVLQKWAPGTEDIDDISEQHSKASDAFTNIGSARVKNAKQVEKTKELIRDLEAKLKELDKSDQEIAIQIQTAKLKAQTKENIATQTEAEEKKKAEEEAQAKADAEADAILKEEQRLAAEHDKAMRKAAEDEAKAIKEARLKADKEVMAERKRRLTELTTMESDAAKRLAAAQSKVAEAWAWYRDKDKMAAQLKEEKAEEAAQKQFEKDFEDLKWRRDWRTAKDLSVDQEAVRRVALAKEEETAAQKALAETAKSTAQAAASLAEIEKVITQEG